MTKSMWKPGYVWYPLMMALSDRPYGPNNGGAAVVNQVPINQQSTTTVLANGPLPVLQSLVGTAETQIMTYAGSAIPLSIASPPDTQIEQTPFDVWISGYAKTTASGSLTFKVYEGNSATIGSNSLLGSSGAITQNTATAAWWAHLVLIFDSVSGVLAGKIDFYVNKGIVASVTLSNFPTGFLNSGNPQANPPTVANLPTFTLTVASSGAGAGTPTSINVQKFSCG